MRRWRQLIKRIDEVDPHRPSCGGDIKIIASIVDHAIVDAIRRHLARRSHAGRVHALQDDHPTRPRWAADIR